MTRKRKAKGRRNAEVLKPGDVRMQPDHSKGCEVCGCTPIVPLTGMCGPCTFGEADTADGNW